MHHFSVMTVVKGVLWILGAVSVGCFVGSILEYRRWTKITAVFARPLIRFGRLPEVCGTAFITALASNNAAASMLAAAHNDEKLSRRNMVIGAMINSFPAKYSHLLRLMPIIILLLGTVGLAYCGIQLLSELILTGILLSIARFWNRNAEYEIEAQEKEPIAWKDCFPKAFKRTGQVLLRVVLVTIPLYVLVSFLAYKGVFNSKVLRSMVPESLSHVISPESFSIVIAKLGGLTSACTIAGKMHTDGAITGVNILVALMIANLLTIPFSTLRRNLPTALGIYPGKTNGMVIAFSLMGARMVLNIATIIVLFSISKI